MNFNKGIGFSNEVTSSTIPTVSYPKTILSCPKTGLIFAVGRLLTTLYQYQSDWFYRVLLAKTKQLRRRGSVILGAKNEPILIYIDPDLFDLP